VTEQTKKAADLQKGDRIRLTIGGEEVEGEVTAVQTGIRDDPSIVVIDLRAGDDGYYRQDLPPDQDVTVLA
jgi:hypothetical protein